MQKTGIEYLTHTWNPIAMRCRPIGPGCDNCWHLMYADRLAHCPGISTEKKLAYQGIGTPILDDVKELYAPLKMKKRCRIGVQFMGDLFHNTVIGLNWDMALSVYKTVQEAKQHKFFVLTKRSFQLKELDRLKLHAPNIWTGVSVENQETAEIRIRDLARCQSPHKWLSIEPLLGEIDLHSIIGCDQIHWVVVGVETGPGARPAKIEWVRSIILQCKALYIPCFFKNAKNNALFISPDLRVQQYPEALNA